MMKNKFYIVGILIALFIVGGTIYLLNNSNTTYFKEITTTEVEKMINDKKTFLLYIKQDNCNHCKAFTPVMEKVLKKYKVQGYYVNLSNLTEEDGTKFDSLIPNITGTPTTVFFEDGTEAIMERIIGGKTEDSLVQKLKNLGYIK